MARIFILPADKDGKLPQGEKIINKRYRFVDGKLEVDEDTAQKIHPVLVGYFGCKVENAPEPAEQKAEVDQASLAASNTKK